MRDLDSFASLFTPESRVVILTGAGISASSGIETFRSPRHQSEVRSRYGVPLEELLSYRFCYEHSDLFWDYLRRYFWSESTPNPAHFACVALEKYVKHVTIITQNIDGLHEQAGSQTVIPLHGTLGPYYCSSCETYFGEDDPLLLGQVPTCPKCEGNPRGQGLIRPSIVLYQEDLNETTQALAIRALKESDIFLMVGTSGTVYPAAGFWQYAHGDVFGLINTGPTPLDDYATHRFFESAETFLPRLVQKLEENLLMNPDNPCFFSV